MLYDFGPRLLKLRKDKNLTQQMVVERAKGFDPNLRLSDSVLGKYESDLAVPRLTEAAALADVLNVSLDYLTSGEKCNVLSLKELSPEQVQLLMDLTAYIDIVIAATQTAALITDAGTHHIPGILQLPNRCADSVHALLIDGGKPFEGIIPVVRQGKHLRQQTLGFQGQIFVAKMMIAHNGIVLNALYAKNSHFTNPFM